MTAAQHTPVLKDDSAFLKKTNEDYAAWCKTFYAAERLDHRGMMSLHGLWAWQEQERRANLASAAAPDLLAALQLMLMHAEAPSGVQDGYSVRRAREAIAKATGSTS